MGTRSGKLHGKRLPDGTYELIAFVDGLQVTHPFIHRPGENLFRTRARYSNWAELLSAQEGADDTLIYSVSDIDGFIDVTGMKRLEP